jgi:hypothetical protein
MSPTPFSVMRWRAPAGSPSMLVASSTVVDAPTTVAANSAATAVPTNAGRCARRAALASPVLMGSSVRARRARAPCGGQAAPDEGCPHPHG